MSPPSRLGAWAVFALSLVAATALYTDLIRLVNPVGEKFIPGFPPGQNDFSYPYIATRALLSGLNPYRNDHPEFNNPWFKNEHINGVDYKMVYPPGHLVTMVPLVLWKGARWEEAARVWFRFNLLALAALAALAWWAIQRITGVALSPLWGFLLFVALSLNPGVELGLDRGQSDILMALLAWGAIACYLRGASGIALFLLIWSTSIKGYPVLFTAGLGLLMLLRGDWKQALSGTAAGLLVFALPVWRYFGDAWVGMRFRAAYAELAWYDHGFRNLANRISPAWQEQMRLALTVFAVAVAAAAWVQLWRASARSAAPAGSGTSMGSTAPAPSTDAARTLWLCLFALASMGAVIGYSGHSVSYNLVLLLPGTLILAASQDVLRGALALPAWAGHVLGASLAACLFLLFAVRLGNDPPGYNGGIPGAAYGMGLLFPILAGLAARGLARPIALPSAE